MFKIDLFLKTYNPREETIIRYRFGIGVKRKTDPEIIDNIRRYAKCFNATTLRRHYDYLTASVNSLTRREYGVKLNFKTGVVTLKDEAMQAELVFMQTLTEIMSEITDEFLL